MKVLYVARLFSGLETSFINKIWLPTGVPTIYKIIEELDKNYETKFLFSVKDSGNGYSSSWKERKDSVFNISGLKQSIHVLSGIEFFPTWISRKFAMIFRDLRQAFVIIIEVIRFKPDIIYCDHANVIVAAILSRYQNSIPVVFRAMGVYPFMRAAPTRANIIHRIYNWAYHSPFDFVICTQDGSGVEPWLNNVLRNGVKNEVLLNGVDKKLIPDVIDERLQLLSKKKNIILFIGKLERDKGCYEFEESILLMLNKKPDEVHGLVIGTGSEERNLKELVKRYNCMDGFTFIDRLPHKQIAAAHKISEIYVSMNHLGNLSNANLEAIQSNDCMVIPYNQPDTGIDVVTNKLLEGVVVNAPIEDPDKLSAVLRDLIYFKNKRLSLSESINIRKKQFLWSWKDRIAVEMNLLENLVKDKV